MIAELWDWWPYAIRDEEYGWVIGIRDDAPPEIKESYEGYLERKREGKED